MYRWAGHRRTFGPSAHLFYVDRHALCPPRVLARPRAPGGGRANGAGPHDRRSPVAGLPPRESASCLALDARADVRDLPACGRDGLSARDLTRPRPPSQGLRRRCPSLSTRSGPRRIGVSAAIAAAAGRRFGRDGERAKAGLRGGRAPVHRRQLGCAGDLGAGIARWACGGAGVRRARGGRPHAVAPVESTRSRWGLLARARLSDSARRLAVSALPVGSARLLGRGAEPMAARRAAALLAPAAGGRP
jgi:hypothetical protein